MENTKTTFRPILFATPMVQAILEGRKTMTRRIIKPQPPLNAKFIGITEHCENRKEGFYFCDGTIGNKQGFWPSLNESIYAKYNIGDVLWVRENYYTASNWDHWKPSMLKSVNVEVFYVADLPNHYITRPLSRGKTRPCIFLPKEYARIFLKIKSIRVERLQSISREDARSEGIERDLVSGTKYKNYVDGSTTYNEQSSFYSLWESINGKKNLESNPFVFVYEFEQIEKPKDFIL